MFDDLQSYAEAIITQHNIPAVSLALWKDGQLRTAAAGILNKNTGVEATRDSIFQIGSVSKLFTTCLVMKLVEQGQVDLNNPLKNYLRDFQLADKQASESITVRQLLNHTSGIAGDYFPDDAKEDGPHIARLVDRCAQLPLMHPVGGGFSYCNVGFTLAGRLVEVITGMSWYDTIEEMIFRPLKLEQSICRPADVISFRTAIGHVPDPDNPGQEIVCSSPYLNLSHAPAGCTITMSAADLMTFSRALLLDDLSGSNAAWLSPASLQTMQTATVDLPYIVGANPTRIGLGWFMAKDKDSGHSTLYHSGATNGQCSLLKAFPEQQAAFVMLLNSEKAGVYEAISEQLTEALVGVKPSVSNPTTLSPAPTSVPSSTPMPTLSPDALSCYVGRYRSYLGEYTFYQEGDELLACFDWFIGEEPQDRVRLQALGEHCFALFDEEGSPAGRIRFLEFDECGVPQQVFTGIRLYQRTSSGS